MDGIEYRVRPVVKYQVTRWHQWGKEAGCESLGLFDNENQAEKVCTALMGSDDDYQEFVRGEGNPYALVYKGFDDKVLDVRRASSRSEADQIYKDELEAGNEYRLYRRVL